MAEKEGSSDRDTAMDLDDADEIEDPASGPSRKRQCNGQTFVRNAGLDDCKEDNQVDDADRMESGHEEEGGANRKRITKNDSGISVEREQIDDDDVDKIELSLESAVSESEDRTKVEVLRLKVNSKGDLDEKSSPDSGHQEGDDDNDYEDTIHEAMAKKTTDKESKSKDFRSAGHLTSNDESGGDGSGLNDVSDSMKSDAAADDLSVSSSNEDDEGDGEDDEDEEAAKTKPKHNWFLCPEVMRRQYGISNNVSSDLFRLRAYGSLHMVERLELMYMMKRHDGCVNTLHFNTTGTRLASGSDDLNVVIWDWAIGEPLIVYDSGHRSNVFQAKFMPLGGDCLVVSCARDGQVRLAELSTTGVCKGTRRLASHKGAAHKLALEYDSPHTFLSCGEDGVVFEVDLRESKAERLLTCKENDRKVPLYTIFAHPTNVNEFAVGGKDHFVRVYDKRQINQGGGAVKKYCPHHILSSDIRANVTCLVYNHNGSELLASYNDEDIYTFNTSHSDGADFTHRYRGHRNSATVKGVNYFGPNSEFVVSGSDCGNIYVWERGTERVVQFMAGDEGGVVNCLEPHPHIPVLATSGLDDSVKIWVPSCENAPKLGNLRSVTRSNRREREEDRRREPETIDGQMLWFLMHHLRRSARRRARQDGEQVEGDSPSENEETNSDDDDDNDGNNYGMSQSGVQCTTA